MSTSLIISRLGTSVRTRRHGLGISQEALAERADLHRTYIADIERGARNVTLKSLEKLAGALDVSVATLLVDADGPTAPAPWSRGDTANGQCVEILLVEDNRKDLKRTLQAFQQARISNPLRLVYDGQQALDFLFCTGRFSQRKLEDRPLLVLLDLSLPGVGGVEVLRRIKADIRTQAIPVVVLTNSRSFNVIGECLGLGAETYIVKPANSASMAAAAQKLGMSWLLLDRPAKP